jgi:carboxyl-terminal processing protease
MNLKPVIVKALHTTIVLLAVTVASGKPEVETSGLVSKVVDALDQHYLYAASADWQHLRSALLANSSLSLSSLDKKLAVLRDSDLRIVSSQELAGMQAETAGHESGIGLVDFAVAVDQKTGMSKVVTPLVDSPAFKANLLPGDIIFALNGRRTRSLTHEQVMALLRGNSGMVRMVVHRRGKYMLLKIAREQWQEHAVSSLLIPSHPDMGYIAIRLFTPESGEQTRKVAQSFAKQGVTKCILDLRNNPGGYLDAMAAAGGVFTDQILGWKIRRDNTREPIRPVAKPHKTLQVVVLVNEGTASAAEVLAAGLRDTLGARLIGTRTYGRGQMQTFVQLGDGAGVVIPSAKVESPHGSRFNKGFGIVPDVFIPVSRPTDGRDLVYKHAIELLLKG